MHMIAVGWAIDHEIGSPFYSLTVIFLGCFNISHYDQRVTGIHNVLVPLYEDAMQSQRVPYSQCIFIHGGIQRYGALEAASKAVERQQLPLKFKEV